MPAAGMHANCTWLLRVTDSDSLIRAMSLLPVRQKERQIEKLLERICVFEIFGSHVYILINQFSLSSLKVQLLI